MSESDPFPAATYLQAFDPDFLRGRLRAAADLLAGYWAEARAGQGPVLRQRPMAEILRDLDFDALIRRGGGDLDALAAKILADCNRLQHPRYFGHQVAVPAAASALADAMHGATNNGMAVYEMGPAGTAIERGLTGWMLSKVGWEGAGDGVMTHGGSLANLTCLLAARARALPGAWEEGMPARCAILAPEPSHYSIARAAGVLGLGTQAVIPIAVDGKLRALPGGLEEAHARAAREGRTVIAAVANAGVTATGAYDDLGAAADFCSAAGIWLHVDGAHGASALLSPRHRGLLRGLERADSLTWDTHKLLATSSLGGVALFRRREDLDRCFAQQASYLFAEADRPGEDISKRTLECTKAQLSLKLFFTLALWGEAGLAAHVERLHGLAREFHGLIAAEPGCECLAEPESNILLFRLGRDSALQDRLRETVVGEGDFYLTRATVKGESWLRLVLMNPFTAESDIRSLCARLRDLAAGA